MRITSPSFVLLVVLASACISDPSTMSYTPGSLSEPDAASDISPADTSWPDAVTMDSEGDTFDARREDMPEEDAAPRPDIITEHFFSSCATLLAAHPETVDGRYTIAPMEGVEVEVYCDMQTDGGVGYTMKRIDDAEHLLAHQGAYREACAALGMEVIVPRTRAHALSIYSFNQDRTPNLVNVFPRHDGAVGLGEWEGRCQGQPCSFYLSETDNSNCTRTFEPNGNNHVDGALFAKDDTIIEGGDYWCYGRWDDSHDRMDIVGHVICSTNDTTSPIRASCHDYIARDEVYNAGPEGTSGLYRIEDANGPFEVYCDMATDGGGWTLVWKNTGASDARGARSNAVLWEEAAQWAPGQAHEPVSPHQIDSASAVDARAWHHFTRLEHQRWAKLASLHRVESGERHHDQTLHIQFGADRYIDVVENETHCKELNDFVEVYVNGTEHIGRTRHLIRSGYANNDTSIAYGLASTGNRTTDHCGQQPAEIIHQSGPIIRLADASGTLSPAGSDLRAITFVFSYVHDGEGVDRNRCMYNCWGSSTAAAFYDAFVWGVRGPLAYDSCQEVRRLDPLAPSGEYLVDGAPRNCIF